MPTSYNIKSYCQRMYIPCSYWASYAFIIPNHLHVPFTQTRVAIVANNTRAHKRANAKCKYTFVKVFVYVCACVRDCVCVRARVSEYICM